MPGGKYERRIVAFLDILGFSRLVENADDPEWRQAIEEVVVTMRKTLAPNEAADLRLTQFSDCIVISATLAHYGCNLVMTSAIVLANNLLGRTVLLRGGIAVGNLALWVEKTHGERGWFHIAQQQDRLLAAGDFEGMKLWRSVGARWEKLRAAVAAQAMPAEPLAPVPGSGNL